MSNTELDISQPTILAYTVVLGNKPGERIGIVKYNEQGYYLTDFDNKRLTLAQVREHVEDLNTRMGLPLEVSEAMTFGSLFGWGVPGAEPAHRYFAAKEKV